MRIAIFHNLLSGGSKRALYEFCSRLHQRGFILDLYIPETANEDFLPLEPFLNRKRIFPFKRIKISRTGPLDSVAKFFSLNNIRSCQKKMAKQIDKGGYNAVFVHPCQYTHAPYLLRYLKTPSIYFCAEPYRIAHEEALKRAVMGRWMRLLATPYIKVIKAIDMTNAGYSTFILTYSYYSRETIQKAYGLNSFVNYLGVDTDKFRPLRLEKERMVLSVGGYHWAKGFRFIIRAISMIRKQDRPKLVIIGDRYTGVEEAVLKQLATSLEVEADFLYCVSDEELVRYYNLAAVVVYAPYLEPFGLVALEAMACGVPVVGVNEGGIRETVIHGETGILIQRDEEEFAIAVENLLKDIPLRERLGERGRAVVLERWSWDRATEALLKNLEKAIKALDENISNYS